MNYIRVRVAVMLAVSMLCVVCISTLVMSYLVADLVDKNFRSEFTHRISRLASSLTFDGSSAVFHLSKEPIEGAPIERETIELQDSFKKAGVPYEVAVVDSPSGTRVASVDFGAGHITWPFPDNTLPAHVWYGVAGYIGLITAGVLVVAFFAAYQATKQLRFLEAMAQAVLADGTLSRVPEEGAAEIKATARALNRMGDSFKRLIDSKMRLVAAASHDFRTPMTRMRIRAEFLGEDERADWLHDLDELDRIADSAIQLVREETVSKGNELVRVDELVRKVCGDVISIKLRVEVKTVSSAIVQASPLALTRALRNLVINAATHGGGAMVEARLEEGVVQIIIDDTGPGIPEESLSSAFEPFFRVDPARRQLIPGAGLGLAIAKEIIERQGGTLTISNRPPTGLRQIVTLKLPSKEAALELAVQPQSA